MSLLGNLIKAPSPQRMPQTIGRGNSVITAGYSGLAQWGPAGQQAMLGAYGQVSWLYATISRISEATASTVWRLYQTQPSGDRSEIFRHPALDLWNSISPFETPEEYREAGQQHLELVGEWWTVLLRDNGGVPVELQLVRPDRMRPVPDRDKVIAGYVYSLGAETIPLAVQDVLLIKRPNPLDPYRGLGPVQSLMADLDSEKSAANWTRNFFRNSAEPGGVIEYEDALSDLEFERLVKRWQEQHQGVSNAHRVAVIERGHWKDRAMTMRNMQFVDLRKLTRDLVAGAFGIPVALLGVSESVNRANAEAAEVMFGRWVIRPRLERIKSALNRKYLPNFDTSGTLEFDFDNPVPDDRAIDLSEATEGYAQGILTQNEARLRLDEGEVPGGDEFKPQGADLFGGFDFGEEGQRQWKGWSKADDPLLPAELERQERRIARNWARRLKSEMEALLLHLREFMARRVKIELSDIDTYDWDWWEKYNDEVIEELTRVAELSIRAGFTDLAPVRVQMLAAAYARQRGEALLTLGGEFSLVGTTRRRVNELVAQTIDEGWGLGKLRSELERDLAFSPDRATMVARTETATALGQGQKSAAIEQGRDEKHWVTQADIRVDDKLCRANERQGWIKLGDPFQSGHDTVPAHPNCRCVVRYRTSGDSAVDPGEGLAEDLAGAIAESRIIPQLACPRCQNKLPIRNFRGAADGYCRKCKLVFPVITDMHESERKVVVRDDDGRIVDVRILHSNGRH